MGLSQTGWLTSISSLITFCCVLRTPLEDFPPRLDDESMALFKQHMEGTVPKSDPIASEPIA